MITLLSDRRSWVAVFIIYACGFIYGILTLGNQIAVQKKLRKVEKFPSPAVREVEAKDTPLRQDLLLGRPIDVLIAEGPVKPRLAVKAGNARVNATVAIGIPSVKRIGEDYLPATIDSLLQRMSPEEKTQTVIVIYIGETDVEYVSHRVKTLQSRFPSEIADGTLEVVAPSETLYPDWEKLVVPSLGDTLQRSIWRSKQNLDQMFLMMHIYHLSPVYYLMMEDDVVAARWYMTKLLQAIKIRRNRKWIYFSFCGLGAIGKLFPRQAMPSFVSFLQTFWNVKPLDWLLTDFLRCSVCSYDESEHTCSVRVKTMAPRFHHSLFQHVGQVSSLPGKMQRLRDASFRP